MITKPHFESEYLQGPTAGFVDWVAGGNFDGFVQQKSIRFIESNVVIIKTIILDQSRYDGNVKNSEIKGHFDYTDKDTLTIKIEDFEMRGKIVGKNKEYLVFSINQRTTRESWNEVYELNKAL